MAQLVISVKDNNGQFKQTHAGEIAELSLNRILESPSGDGWWFLHIWLCKVLIDKAKGVALTDPEQADLWYSRYQAIRGIK